MRAVRGEFADDVVLVTSAREAAKAAGSAYEDDMKALDSQSI